MEIIGLPILLLVLLIALSVHEFAHAYTADKLGDPTPRMQGRVTLNPIKHLDPIGTLLLLVTIVTPGPAFGWGKPVMFNPMNLKSPKRDVGLVAAAGPASNIIMAALGLALLPLVGNFIIFSEVLVQFIVINVVLAVFNLIPIYPLDGFNVTTALLPNELSSQFKETARYGTFVLLLLIFTGTIQSILYPVLNVVLNIISVVS